MLRQPMYPISSLSLARGVQPGPSGFADSNIWREQATSQSERAHLDHLLGLALLDQDVKDCLLVQHDPTLLESFDLSDETRQQLASVQANTLEELAQVIVAAAIHYRERLSAGAI